MAELYARLGLVGAVHRLEIDRTLSKLGELEPHGPQLDVLSELATHEEAVALYRYLVGFRDADEWHEAFLSWFPDVGDVFPEPPGGDPEPETPRN